MGTLFASIVLLSSPSVAMNAPASLSASAGNQSVSLSWAASTATGFPFSFNGTTYNEVFVGSNSYLTFGNGSTVWNGFSTSNPALPGVHICAGDWSYQTVQYRIDNSVVPNQLRIRFQGTAARSSSGSSNMIYEAVFYKDMSYFDLLIGTYSACSYSSSKILTNGSYTSTSVAFAANTNWRVSGLTATQNGHAASWIGSSSASVAANSNGWSALDATDRDDAFIGSRQLPTSYLVQASSNGGTTWSSSINTYSTSTTYTYTSLTNGTSYVFRVAPYNSNTAATGAWSTTSSAVTPAIVAPGQPTSLVATSGNGRATLSWVAPALSGDSAISGYRIEYSSNGGSSWTTATSNTYTTSTLATVTSLANGTSYLFRVAAINSWSTGPYSSTSSATPAIVAPGQPTSLVATSGNDQVTLSWAAPALSGDSAISGYRIEYSSNGGSSWSVASTNTYSTSTTRTVTWLTNGTVYVFRVAAINSSSTGSYSATATAVPNDPNKPLAPLTLVASPGDGQTVLSWSAVSARYLSGYRIEYSINSGSSWWTVNSNTYSSSTTRTITGLVNGTSYMFRVAAVDSYYGVGHFKSVAVTASRSVSVSKSKSGSSATSKSKKKSSKPATRYVSKSFSSTNTKLSLVDILKAVRVQTTGMTSISGSVVSYIGEPCRVAGRNLLRVDQESSCVVRVTMRSAKSADVVATVTIVGQARTQG